MNQTDAEISDSIATVLDRMRDMPDKPAIFFNGREYSYSEYMALIDNWSARLKDASLGQGSVVAIRGEFAPSAMALIWALAACGAIVAPLTIATAHQETEFLSIAGAEALVVFEGGEFVGMSRLVPQEQNALVESFRAKKRPGLIVFTSGSTGKPKGILHDLERVTRKFVKMRPSWRTVMFLMFDHFGGMNTFLSSAAYGGVAVCLPSRAPDIICRAIEEARATLLPTTPTFLNLLLTSGAHRQCDLSSVKLITYGTEVMSPGTLERVCKAFPNAEVKQTYGLSELGVLRSKSEGNDSTWVRIGGDGFEVDVRDNILWIRSEANMIGYLNAPSPFDENGWFCTGDAVELRGDYMRILGRKSELINVGGQKVYPAEIEEVLLKAPNVLEASVFSAPHPVLGKVAHAKITLAEPEDALSMSERLRKHCLQSLERFKVPMKFIQTTRDEQMNSRFKKVRLS
ncbi:MAG: long-chain fatty acid--CoA ligase [Verrucomicrobiaceae bacterium]|nr:MAG: long-chain fatty acid--CoA ligase [Verrucomicrobiaceae bacterium]